MLAMENSSLFFRSLKCRYMMITPITSSTTMVEKKMKVIAELGLMKMLMAQLYSLAGEA